MTEDWFSTKWSFVQIECVSDKRTRNFRRIRKIWGSNPKTSWNFLFYSRAFFHLNETLSTRRSHFWQPRRVFSPKSPFFIAKVKNSWKVKKGFSGNTISSSKHSSVHVHGSLIFFLELLLQSFKQLLLRFLKGVKKENCWENFSEWSSGDAKCNFATNAENILPEVLKV